MAENKPLSVNNTNVYLSTAIPVYWAASGLLPIEYIFFPTEVLWRINANTKESKRKVKATIHWVCSKKAKKIIVNQYDTLFLVPDPDKHEDFIKYVNPNSLVKKNGYIEPYASKLKAGERVQFQRQGYFIVDKINADKEIIFNKTTGLRDSFKNQKNIR